jgi:hypothetical protein
LSDAHARTLYATLDQARFFHVPVEAELVPGGLPVRTLSGGRIDLDPSFLAPYEVDEPTAKAIVREQLGTFMEFAGQAIGQLQGLAQRFAEARDQLDQVAAGQQAEQRAEQRKAQLSDALQIDPESVDDPAQVMRGLNALMQRVQARMADPEQLAKAGVREAIRDDMSKLGAAATNQAVGDADQAVADARAALLELFGSDETRKALREATDELRRVRGEMQQAGVVPQREPDGNRPGAAEE